MISKFVQFLFVSFSFDSFSPSNQIFLRWACTEIWGCQTVVDGEGPGQGRGTARSTPCCQIVWLQFPVAWQRLLQARQERITRNENENENTRFVYYELEFVSYHVLRAFLQGINNALDDGSDTWHSIWHICCAHPRELCFPGSFRECRVSESEAAEVPSNHHAAHLATTPASQPAHQPLAVTATGP